jgi:hypothetical protein
MTLNGLPGYSPEWLNGQQIFSLVVVDSKDVFMEEYDGYDPFNILFSPPANPPFGNTLRGELDLQQTSDFTVPPSGACAFAWTHAGPSFSQPPFAGYYGGVLNADGTGNITGFSMDRYIDGATGTIASGIYGAQSFGTPDSFGYGTVNVGPYALNYFLVDSGHLIVIGSSSLDGTGLPAGHIYSQPSTMPSVAATYIFTLAGSTPVTGSSGFTVVGSNPQALGGWATSDASGNLTGYLDTNNNGTVESAAVAGTIMASAVPGRWVMTLAGGGASSFAVYPTASHGLLMFQLDNQKSGTGTVEVQTGSSPAISGNYAVSIQQLGTINSVRSAKVGLAVGAWTDISGQIMATNSSTLVGTVDIDQINGVFLGPSGNIWTETTGQSVTGNFSAGAQGRFSATITTNQLGPLSAILYVVDSSHVVLLEDDSTPAAGVLQLQNF